MRTLFKSIDRNTLVNFYVLLYKGNLALCAPKTYTANIAKNINICDKFEYKPTIFAIAIVRQTDKQEYRIRNVFDS